MRLTDQKVKFDNILNSGTKLAVNCWLVLSVNWLVLSVKQSPKNNQFTDY